MKVAQTFCGVDPDTKSTGFARVGPDGVIVGVAVAKEGRLARDRMDAMANAINFHAFLYQSDVVAVEWQRIRPSDRRPDDILSVGAVAGMALAAAASWGPVATYLPYPSEWKGTVSKREHQARILRAAGLTLESDVFKSVPKAMRTHCVDALGLALWAQEKYRLNQVIVEALQEAMREQANGD